MMSRVPYLISPVFRINSYRTNHRGLCTKDNSNSSAAHIQPAKHSKTSSLNARSSANNRSTSRPEYKRTVRIKKQKRFVMECR